MGHQTLGAMFKFLDGTIVTVDGGRYKVLQRPQQTYLSLSSAKWFLTQRWCDQLGTPAGILTHANHFAFQNEQACHIGAMVFVPPEHRATLFSLGLQLTPGEAAIHSIPVGDRGLYRTVEIVGVQHDPTYGRVVPVRAMVQDLAL